MARFFCRCGRRKVWFVYSYGFRASGKAEGSQLSKVSRPFNSKSAADRYRNAWDNEFQGFAVIDYRLMTAEEMQFAGTE